MSSLIPIVTSPPISNSLLMPYLIYLPCLAIISVAASTSYYLLMIFPTTIICQLIPSIDHLPSSTIVQLLEQKRRCFVCCSCLLPFLVSPICFSISSIQPLDVGSLLSTLLLSSDSTHISFHSTNCLPSASALCNYSCLLLIIIFSSSLPCVFHNSFPIPLCLLTSCSFSFHFLLILNHMYSAMVLTLAVHLITLVLSSLPQTSKLCLIYFCTVLLIIFSLIKQ